MAICKAFNAHDKHIINEIGLSLKFLSASGCFMYIHSASKVVTSLRPNNYDEDDDIGGGIALANEQIARENDPKGGGKCVTDTGAAGASAGEDNIPEDIRICTLAELPAVIDDIITNQQSTPLILDTSNESNVRTFMEYKHILQDVSALTVPFGKSGVKTSAVMENCRKKLVTALKSGTMFCLYLGDCSIEHVDFKKKLCKKDCFPVDTFTGAGQRLFSIGPEGTPRFHSIYREADLESGQCVARQDTFRVCVVSSIHPKEFREKLGDCIPTGYMVPVYISK